MSSCQQEPRWGRYQCLCPSDTSHVDDRFPAPLQRRCSSASTWPSTNELACNTMGSNLFILRTSYGLMCREWKRYNWNCGGHLSCDAALPVKLHFELQQWPTRRQSGFSCVTRSVSEDEPGQSSGFHVVGDHDIFWPDVVLPLAQTQHSGQHCSSVHPDPHVHIGFRRVADFSVRGKKSLFCNRSTTRVQLGKHVEQGFLKWARFWVGRNRTIFQDSLLPPPQNNGTLTE